jgi:hypothetical protein
VLGGAADLICSGSFANFCFPSNIILWLAALAVQIIILVIVDCCLQINNATTPVGFSLSESALIKSSASRALAEGRGKNIFESAEHLNIHDLKTLKRETVTLART